MKRLLLIAIIFVLLAGCSNSIDGTYNLKDVNSDDILKVEIDEEDVEISVDTTTLYFSIEEADKNEYVLFYKGSQAYNLFLKFDGDKVILSDKDGILAESEN